MAKKLTNGKISIGAYMILDRKKPCLCVEEGNQIIVYGHFNTIDGADKFMDELGRLVGAEMEGAEKARNRRYEPRQEIDFDYGAED